nr:hypothetical protein [Haloarcula taiwanensis]
MSSNSATQRLLRQALSYDNSIQISRKIKIKTGLVVALISISIYLYWVGEQIPTDYARNTFFYADYFVGDQIVATGNVPTDNSFDVTKYWGKINSKIKLPLLPLMLSILKITANVPFSASYTTFPSILIIMASFYILFDKMGVSGLTAIILAVTAGFAVPATPRYPIELYATVTGVMCLGIVVLQIEIRSNSAGHINKIRNLVILSTFLAFLFYWDPEKFFILSGILGFLFALLYTQHRKKAISGLILLSISALLFIQIFELPLIPYIAQLQSSILAFFTLDFSNPLNAYAGGGGGGGGGGQGRAFYSLISLPVLLPLSAIGGFYALTDTLSKERHISLIAVSWGIIAALLSIVFMIASAGWLAGRSYTFAVPVMMIGYARYIKTIQEPLQYLMSGLLLSLVLLSVLLQLTVPLIHLHTYEPGIEDGSKWASEYSDETVITDHKLGAPFAAEGNFDVMYPKDEAEVTQGLFYPHNYTEFSRHATGPVLVSEGMKEYGVRAAGANGPMPNGAFRNVTNRSDLVYSNGRVLYVHED